VLKQRRTRSLSHGFGLPDGSAQISVSWMDKVIGHYGPGTSKHRAIAMTFLGL